MFFATEDFRASTGPTSANKFPLVLKIAQSKNKIVASPNFSRASRCHRNRLYRSLHAKVVARRKVHKYQDTRGRNVNVSWFGVTRTPEDAPLTPEDAPVMFCRYGLVGLIPGPRQRVLRPKTFMPAPVPQVLINSPSC